MPCCEADIDLDMDACFRKVRPHDSANAVRIVLADRVHLEAINIEDVGASSRREPTDR